MSWFMATLWKLLIATIKRGRSRPNQADSGPHNWREKPNKWQLECVNRWQANNKHTRDGVEKGEWCHYMYLPRCMHSDTYEQATTAEETGKSQAKPSNTRLMNLQLTHFGTSFSAFRVATPFPLPPSQGATCCVLRTLGGTLLKRPHVHKRVRVRVRVRVP